MNTIEVRGLTKNFGKKNILKDVNMTVRSGDIYGFLGPNGAGKTTTLRIILGILRPDDGAVFIMGKAISDYGSDLRQRMNVLPESHGFYEWMDAYSYLEFFGSLYGIKPTARDYGKLLGQVGLDNILQQPIRTFSRGMKQRLGIARALINSPEILFLDEPTNGLDPRGRREIHSLLLRLNQERRATIIVCTHILDDVDRLCNRIAILYRGRIRYEGAVKDLSSDAPRRLRLRMGGDWRLPSRWSHAHIKPIEITATELLCEISDISPSEAIRFLIDAGLPVVEVRDIAGGIEETYFSYTKENN